MGKGAGEAGKRGGFLRRMWVGLGDAVTSMGN